MTCDFELRAADMDDTLHQVLQISVVGPVDVEKVLLVVRRVEVQNSLGHATEFGETVGARKQDLLVEPEKGA